MFSAPGALLLAQAGTAKEVAACGPTHEASSVCLAVYRATGNDFLAAVADTLIVKPAKVLFIIVLAFVATRLIGRGIKRFVAGMGHKAERRLGSLREHAPTALLKTDETVSARAAQRAETIGALLRSITAFAVWTVAAFMVLGELGLDLGPLIAGAGIAGVALAFGAQSLVKDFLSGMFMLVEDQFGVGDIVDVGEASGLVEGVSLRTTRLRDVEGTVWHVPNGEIHRVGNKSQQWSRALLDVQVAFETDVDEATRVIKAAADEVWHSADVGPSVLEEPEVWGVERLGPHSIVIRLVVKTAPSDQYPVSRELRQRLKETFDGEGIEIPYPQQTVWNRTVPADDGSAAARTEDR